jgi:hypothetical protein
MKGIATENTALARPLLTSKVSHGAPQKAQSGTKTEVAKNPASDSDCRQ